MNNGFSKNLLVWVLIVLAAMVVFNSFNSSFSDTKQVMSYSDFLSAVNRGEVSEVKVQKKTLHLKISQE